MALSWPVGIVPMTTPASRARGRSEACTVATASTHANTIRIRIARPPRDAPSLNEKGGPKAAPDSGGSRHGGELFPASAGPGESSPPWRRLPSVSSVLEVLAQALQRLQLRGALGQALLCSGALHLLAAVG